MLPELPQALSVLLTGLSDSTLTSECPPTLALVALRPFASCLWPRSTLESPSAVVTVYSCQLTPVPSS